MTEKTDPHLTGTNRWRKSTHSGPEAGACLEVLDNHPTGVPVRDSKTPHAPTLLFPPPHWSSFITAVKDETFRPLP
ncbi:DUF397 domain-containing protein [Streptomyces sp. NPDC056987]|uniref:DUF397 domain-containing protein n=1 Tax=Streptomyces sp. NPDC056987 TaxID=3345988 RepID=UPI00362CAAE3